MFLDKLPFNKNSFLYMTMFFCISYTFTLISFFGNSLSGAFSTSELISVFLFGALFIAAIYGYKLHQKLFRTTMFVLAVVETFNIGLSNWSLAQNLQDTFNYNGAIGTINLFKFFISVAMLMAFVLYFIGYVFSFKTLKEVALVAYLVAVCFYLVVFIAAICATIQINDFNSFRWTEIFNILSAMFTLLGVYVGFTSEEMGF